MKNKKQVENTENRDRLIRVNQAVPGTVQTKLADTGIC